MQRGLIRVVETSQQRDADAIGNTTAAAGFPGGRDRRVDWDSALDLWLAADFVALSLVLFASWVWMLGAHAGSGGHILLSAAGWFGCYALFAWIRRSVEGQRLRSDSLKLRVLDWGKASIAVSLMLFFLSVTAEVPRFWFASVFAVGAVTILLVGSSARSLMLGLADKGVLGQRIAIYGCNEGTAALIKLIENQAGTRCRIDSLFDERGGRGPPVISGYSVGQSFDDLIVHAKSGRVSTVVLDLPWAAKERVGDLVRRLEEVNVDVLMAPSELQRLPSATMGFVGSIPTLALYRRPITGLRAIGKRLIDIGLASLALLLASPVLLTLCVLIKLDSPGPIFFRQKRRGINNEAFNMLKFRSMYIAAEDSNADRLVTRGDARVTRIGKFIRRTSLDELPQLVNVLLGQMSLVGPRPHAYGAKAAERLYEEVVGRYPARHRVLPGITGLAQVRGFRGNTGEEVDISNRVESDLEYIDRWSLGLDLAILARTAAVFLFQKGAY